MDLDKEELHETRKINNVIARKFVEKNYISKTEILALIQKLKNAQYCNCDVLLSDLEKYIKGELNEN